MTTPVFMCIGVYTPSDIATQQRRTEIRATYNAFGDVIVMLICVLAITFWIGNPPGVEAVED